MNSGMELVQQLEQTGDESPLARARLHRQLTVEETARRSGLSDEEVRWLEEGRVYRFPSPDEALLGTLLYATALGIDAAEARSLAGLPTVGGHRQRNSLPRIAVLGAILIALAALLAMVLVPRGGQSKTAKTTVALPPPWRVPITVLNGSGDINYTRQVASQIQAQGYSIRKVGRADSFRYLQTGVYFPPGCESLGLRLAKQLGVVLKPLPGGSGPCQLYVIVGPARGP